MKRALVAAVAALTIVGAAPAPSLHAAPVASQIRSTGTIRRPCPYAPEFATITVCAMTVRVSPSMVS